jgi:predicted RNA-binding protein
MNFKQWLILNEVSDFEKDQMGTIKKSKNGKELTYNYVSQEEWPALREYLVKKSLKNNPSLDPELTAYTPGETLKLLDHPKIKAWFKKMINFRIPDKYGLVILVACAASKPWGQGCKGEFYPSYNQIRKEEELKTGEESKPSYFVTISEPLGVVPQDFWNDFPQYDNPGLFKDTAQQSGMETKDWAESPLQSKIKREMPFDDNAFNRCIEILGIVIGKFIKNNPNHEYISLVEQVNPKKISTHSKMLDIAQAYAKKSILRNPKKPKEGREAYDRLNYVREIIQKLPEHTKEDEEYLNKYLTGNIESDKDVIKNLKKIQQDRKTDDKPLIMDLKKLN